MRLKLLASADALAPVLAPITAAGITGFGVAAVTEPGAGVATFGALWFVAALVGLIRKRR